MATKNPTTTNPVNWRINDFCSAFGIGRTKVYELIKTGDLEAIKFGGRTVITDTSARALLERERGIAPLGSHAHG